jgi:hypothetical protein
MSESGGDSWGSKSRSAEVVGERFAFLCEGLAGEVEERSLLDAELNEAGSEPPAEDS